MQRKSSPILPISLVGVLTLIALSGCQGTLPPPPEPTHQGVVLRVACPAPLAALIGLQSKAWQAHHLASVVVVAPDKPADVRIIAPDALPHLAARGKCTAVPDALRERGNSFAWSSLLTVYREQLLSWDGPPVALPLVGESPLCLYRSDLLTSPEHQKRFRDFVKTRKVIAADRDLRPPASWEDFALIAEYFHLHHPSGKPAPSLPPLPTGSAELDRLFCTVAASIARRAVHPDDPRGPDYLDEVFSFLYDYQTGQPRIASPGFVAAVELLQRLQTCRPEQPRADPLQDFHSGKAVLCITDARALLDVQRSATLRDKVGVCMVPGSYRFFNPRGKPVVAKERVNRVPYLGGTGWLAVVPVESTNKEAAFDLLADLCGPQRSTQIVQDPRFGGGPIRIDQVMRDHGHTFDLDPERSLALKEVLERTLLHGLDNPVLCLRIPDAHQQRDVLVDQLRLALAGKQTAEVALSAVAKQWERINAKKGAGTHLREYRISLGLRDRVTQ